MVHHWYKRLAILVLAAAILTPSLTTPTSAAPSAAPPDGVAIGGEAQCLVRNGGHTGYRINSQFAWFYPDGGPFGPVVTMSGNYSLQLRDPGTGEYQPLFAFPYGFAMTAGNREVRDYEHRTREPHWVFDKVKLEVSWTIEETGASGTETAIIDCTVEPAPEGQQPLTETPSKQPTPTLNEEFVHEFDPSPHPLLQVDSWLLCFNKSSGRRQDIHWGFGTTNNGIGGSDGVLVSGVVRYSTRTRDGEYTPAGQREFAMFMLPRESGLVDDYLPGSAVVAAKLEVEWRLSYGSKVDPGAKLLKLVRTAGCTDE